MDDNDDRPYPDEQHAFSDAHVLIQSRIKAGGNPHHIGLGVLIAAISCLRKTLSYEEIAKIMYEYADDYAVRRLEERE
jgi:hypothetical protein